MLEILLAGGAILLDRISKLWCLGSLKQMPGMKMDVIPGIVEFRYVENRGAAFSILSGRTGLLTVVTALIICMELIFLSGGNMAGTNPFWSGSIVPDHRRRVGQLHR